MMNFNLNGKSFIAVAAMVALEQRAHDHPLALPLLAEGLEISLSSIEQVAGPLRRHGLVQSIRGPGGGYQVARDARDISVADIVAAVDDGARSDSLTPGGAGRAHGSRIHGNWPALSSAMARCLASVSLRDLVDDQPYDAMHEPCADAPGALHRGISTRPVLTPVTLPRYANTVFALAEALK